MSPTFPDLTGSVVSDRGFSNLAPLARAIRPRWIKKTLPSTANHLRLHFEVTAGRRSSSARHEEKFKILERYRAGEKPKETLISVSFQVNQSFSAQRVSLDVL
jgi:hypothetical protein